MTKQHGSIKLAWQSPNARKAAWAIALCSFALVVLLGSLLREQEEKLRENSLTKFARTLSSTALSAGGEADDMLLKVNDLLNVESVLGVRLLQGRDIPLSVGETQSDFPPLTSQEFQLTHWDDTKSVVDIAIRLEPELDFDWIVLRLDGADLMPHPLWGTLINWGVAPLFAFILALVCLWLYGSYSIKPLHRISDFLKSNNGKFASTPVAQDITKSKDDVALLAKQIEAMRIEISEAKGKSDFEARFLHETPYALLRCSVNRKVLYSNVAARNQSALFGDDTKEFVAPALSELVRKAFYETKQVYGDIRCGDTIITFRAIPVLDAGYVNLYGEVSRHIDEDV
ncbi:exported hypothetical protein [Candidatus Terasakiella magnetica]|uniref:Uncharacterized protein n=1 Tax=Candidatus Terasakiella magnetica TaxID=1867952 RepID=A0A1C3RJ55_9PROT|nr:hypothetical protein [Candidatus Terasakiella magnetica]SCA57293.1 exported hypothetical protein [Candidatus Terasakiella magnetica]